MLRLALALVLASSACSSPERTALSDEDTAYALVEIRVERGEDPHGAPAFYRVPVVEGLETRAFEDVDDCVVCATRAAHAGRAVLEGLGYVGAPGRTAGWPKGEPQPLEGARLGLRSAFARGDAASLQGPVRALATVVARCPATVTLAKGALRHRGPERAWIELAAPCLEPAHRTFREPTAAEREKEAARQAALHTRNASASKARAEAKAARLEAARAFFAARRARRLTESSTAAIPAPAPGSVEAALGPRLLAALAAIRFERLTYTPGCLSSAGTGHRGQATACRQKGFRVVLGAGGREEDLTRRTDLDLSAYGPHVKAVVFTPPGYLRVEMRPRFPGLSPPEVDARTHAAIRQLALHLITYVTVEGEPDPYRWVIAPRLAWPGGAD